MKPRAHRVCTFSRLFSDFQNSLALRNTTESSLTKGRSCFALRLIGQGTEMSVFFPHLSKAEHVRQTKNIREIHAFHASLPPARPSTDDSQDVRTLVHVTTPAPIPCPACIWVKAESVPRMFFATSNPLLYGGGFQFSTYIYVFRQHKREPNFFGSPSICPQTYTPIHVQIVSSSQLFFKALHTFFQQNSSR